MRFIEVAHTEWNGKGRRCIRLNVDQVASVRAASDKKHGDRSIIQMSSGHEYLVPIAGLEVCRQLREAHRTALTEAPLTGASGRGDEPGDKS